MTFRPWNRTWAESLDWQKDVWHIPEFFELLIEQQEEYDKAITGQQDAKTTLDNIANFQEKILKERAASSSLPHEFRRARDANSPALRRSAQDREY